MKYKQRAVSLDGRGGIQGSSSNSWKSNLNQIVVISCFVWALITWSQCSHFAISVDHTLEEIDWVSIFMIMSFRTYGGAEYSALSLTSMYQCPNLWSYVSLRVRCQAPFRKIKSSKKGSNVHRVVTIMYVCMVCMCVCLSWRFKRCR